ncbi:MAG: hypothetical protein ACTHOR_03895 [Devosia sp.]|jgi:hypothetical protein|nr:hypothetical protein [Devosiaceae bacterium]
MIRTLAAGFGLAALALTAVPAIAGPSENTFLASLAGNYIGKSTVTDQNGKPQPVTCRLTVAGSTGRATYNGRCSMAGATFSMTGTVAFVGGKYVAAMSGSNGISGNANGVFRGGRVTFSNSGHDTTAGGNRDVVSTLSLAPGDIRVNFGVRDNKTGKTMRGTIPFRRS